MEIISIVNHWESFVKALGCPAAETNEILEEFYSPSYWRTASSSDPQFLATVEAEMVSLRAAMHGRNRNDMRKGFNRAVAVREASRESNKLGRVIKSVLGTQTERFLMAYIKSQDGIIVTHEVLIHDMVTNHFNEWFAIPEYAKTSTLHMSPTWHTAVDSVEAFLKATETSGVPEELRRKLYPSLRHDAYPQANAKIRASFAVSPTLAEYTWAIATLPTNSAAGPTGLKTI